MINVVSVRVGPAYGREYVTILRDMVARNLKIDHRFWCVTDDPFPAEGIIWVPHRPELEGWWQKVALFDPDMPWQGRMLYLDLDSAIVGGLDDLAGTEGIIADWHLPGFNSSVMAWDAGEHADIWTRFHPFVPAQLRSDQDWMNALAYGENPRATRRTQTEWPILPAGWCVSYRSHAVDGPPAVTKVVCFHGRPKPHEVTEGWVPTVWRHSEAAPEPLASPSGGGRP